MQRSFLPSQILLISTFVLCMGFASIAESAPRLQVTENGRFLEYTDGRPFFYLADTAWELFHRLDREEADYYLKDRAAKGFTVIQTVALAELDGLNTPNAYGHRPLIENDPARPDVNEGLRNDYWDHVDYIVERAAELDLFIGLLPTWGSHWLPDGIFTEENARVYGEWIGARYRDKPVIWILGGDRNILSERDRAINVAMAEGLRASVGDTQLITYHPRGPGRSSDYFHNADWLDFNMHQSSHAARDHDNGLFTQLDYALDPPKPTLDGEPRYESIWV